MAGADDTARLPRRRMGALGCLVLVCGMLAGPVQAQYPRMAPPQAGRSDSLRVSVRKMDVNLVRTPYYRGATSDNRANAKDDWLQLQVEYQTDGAREGWLDEIELVWHVAILRKNQTPVVMSRSVTYVDIEDETHYAATYVRPKLLQRLSGTRRLSRNDVRFYVEIKVDGKRVADSYLGQRPQAAWWEYQPPRVDRRDSDLLNRLETPFAPLDYDFYEQIKRDASR